ncbi:carbon-nitrogen hydrolase family protein [Kribbella sandramycini]|uniref:Carbon-nitrogen hydrolase family protein n=1 Tax=Kribbella sandramycini TaxID=60450 RepID=A0A7Y4L1P1_9ACTN|nr:carbon-nitrogen hydrolase family protein [Kribbella sandramycini]MBB6565613.1 putative amidohydrolase [Kribbella sandramycini]NOL41877.1 carbon-nitrogen hydrolase family protein [Kribbella sandramycini]
MTGIRTAIARPTITADPAANGKKVRSLMRKAAAGRARLVQFPEGMLSGYAKAQIADWADVDWRLVRAELEEIMALAGELGVWVVLGSAHPLTPPNRPHNSLYVISDTGALVDRYDKRYCSHTEITHFYSPGFEPVVFDVDGYRFGTLICIEVNFPQLFAQYERLGVECLLLSTYGADDSFETKAAAHAAINCYWVAVSVPALPDEPTPAGLITPAGLYTTQAAGPAELTFATIDRQDPALSTALRHARPWRATAAKGDLYRAHAVTDPRSTNRTAL